MNEEFLVGIGRHVITKVLIIACMTALFAYLKNQADHWAGLEGGPQMASYPSGFRYFAVFAWLLPAAFAYGVFTSETPISESTRNVIFGVAAVFAVAAAAMTLEAFIVRMRWDDSGIEVRTPWRGYRKVSWGALRRVDYSQTNRWFRIHTADQGTIYLHDFMGGRSELLQEIRTNHEHVLMEIPPVVHEN